MAIVVMRWVSVGGGQMAAKSGGELGETWHDTSTTPLSYYPLPDLFRTLTLTLHQTAPYPKPFPLIKNAPILKDPIPLPHSGWSHMLMG